MLIPGLQSDDSTPVVIPCVNDMSTLGALESPGGFTWVRRTSDVIGRVVPVVLPGDAAAGFGVGCTVACYDGVATT